MRSKRIELILDTLKGVKGAKDLSKSVETVSDRLGDTARQGEKAGRAIDDFGDQSSEAARAAAKLDHEIEQLTGSLRELAIAQALTGESSAKQIREQESQLRRLSRNRKLFAGLGDEAAPEFAASFSSRLGPLLAKMPISGPVLAAVGGVAAAAAPLLGAAIAGGIIGGVGVGGVVGGLALAANDERVAKATGDLGQKISERLNRGAGVFVNPYLEGLREIDRTIQGIDIESIFRESARLVPALTEGVASAVGDLGESIELLVRNAGPPVAAISMGIELIGRELGEGLGSLADNGETAGEALATLLEVTGSAIQTTFMLVNALTELYGISQAIGGDFVLKTLMKLTGNEMENAADAADKMNAATAGATGALQIQADQAAATKLRQEALTAAQKNLTQAQNNYQGQLEALVPAGTRAIQLTDGLRQASQNLFGAAIAGVEANEAYAASWDSLSESVKANGHTLNINTAAGRSNRDSLQALLTANNEMYYANIAAGVSIDEARKKHEKRTTKIREEAHATGLDDKATKDIIRTYGKVPPQKVTDLIAAGIDQMIIELKRVYVAQRALAEGKTVAQIRHQGTMAAFSSLHTGGYTGDGGKYEPKGVVHGGEWVFDKETTTNIRRQNPGFLEEALATKQLPGYDGGGFVAPVETRRRIPMAVDVSGSYVMPKALALSKVTPAVPSGHTSDWIERVARMLVPGIRTLSKDRPGARTLSGNASYHGMGRAVDFEPSEKLARLWNERYKSRTKEFISPYQQWNINNGRDWTATGAVWRQHNFAGGNPHDHIAMIGGGVIPEPVFGVGRSGRTYSFAENGRPERVLSAGQTAAGGSTVTIAPVININGANQNMQQLAREVSRTIGRTMDIYTRGVG